MYINILQLIFQKYRISRNSALTKNGRSPAATPVHLKLPHQNTSGTEGGVILNVSSPVSFSTYNPFRSAYLMAPGS